MNFISLHGAIVSSLQEINDLTLDSGAFSKVHSILSVEFITSLFVQNWVDWCWPLANTFTEKTPWFDASKEVHDIIHKIYTLGDKGKDMDKSFDAIFIKI